jgi:hypothetical protein
MVENNPVSVTDLLGLCPSKCREADMPGLKINKVEGGFGCLFVCLQRLNALLFDSCSKLSSCCKKDELELKFTFTGPLTVEYNGCSCEYVTSTGAGSFSIYKVLEK